MQLFRIQTVYPFEPEVPASGHTPQESPDSPKESVMRTFARLSLSSLLLLLALSVIVRADAPASQKSTGTITGRVVDADGKPVAGAHVRAFDVQSLRQSRQNNKDNPSAPKESRPQAVAKTETAADGTFTLAVVPAGRIRVIAGLQGSGLGMAREPVTLKPDETKNIGDITLRKPPASRPNPGTHNKPTTRP